MKRSDNSSVLDRLSSLSSTAAPPAELEDRVVAALRSHGLVAPSPPIGSTTAAATADRRPWRFALAASLAASLLAALGGWFAHGLWNQGPARSTPPDPHYLLLLSEPEELRTERALPDSVAEYRDWAQELAAEGRLVTAGRLVREGARLQGQVIDGIFGLDESELRAATGYFVIRAADLSAASALAQTCPHLKYGGVITVRPIASGG